MRTLVALIIALALAGCGIPASGVMWLQTKRYSGDGVIHNCSNLIGAGYRIDFPEFDASRSFSASYRMAHVPKVFGRDPLIYLKFRCESGSSDEIKKRVTASFRITLLDSTRTVIRSIELPMSTSIWWEAQNLCGAYDLEKSPFRFQSSASYILEVSYDPGPVPPPTKRLYFSVDNCAFY
jgi:hypothetical protein